MQTLRKKTSPCKYRNDPGRFFGDGVIFKAKLIGILEVGEARGDRMCQEALQDLKMAIRAAGEHKQRITIHVTIDGLRLRDEKTGDSLYHHPVHKISFIAQDMTDSRAFGYIFGSPDSGHRFFGIKTDKAASQVVLAMRDLFQVVFELKKKEIELARQHIKTIHEHQSVTVKNNVENTSLILNKHLHESLNSSSTKGVNQVELSPESVADLVDLEQELSSIQRGITQMERITPNEVPSKTVLDNDDPFGDSFTNFSQPSYNLLPPPDTSRSRHIKPLKLSEEKSLENSPSSTQATSSTTIIASNSINSSWINSKTADPVFDEIKTTRDENIKIADELTVAPFNTNPNLNEPIVTKYVDAFTDLDPLGTGKRKPYVDKKFFFQDLKNPPKKVLKDMSGQDVGFTVNFSSSTGFNKKNIKTNDNTKCDIEIALFDSFQTSENGNNADIFGNNTASSDILKSDSDVLNRNKTDDGNSLEIRSSSENICDSKKDFRDSFLAFSNETIDPFSDNENFSKANLDPFDFNFSKTTITKSTILPETKNDSFEDNVKDDKKSTDSVFNGPLQVNLPPESWSSYIIQKKIERQSSESNSPTALSTPASIRNRPSVFKQNTVDVISSISSKKMKPHLFGQKFSKRDSNSINMRRLQESDSLSENETAPEPPPRPDSGSHIEPPPLPPKKQFSDIVIRPSPRPFTPSTVNLRESQRYDYIGSKLSKSHQSDNTLPLPLPSRRIGRTESTFPGPGRPHKKSDDDDYLTPISTKNELPILLPPPQTKTGTKIKNNRKQESLDHRNKDKQEISKSGKTNPEEPVLPDITLSQLLILSIDELASKLNVSASKLSTMTLVELTSYLSEFLANTERKTSKVENIMKSSNTAKIFENNFDEGNEAMFVAKFDDNFGESNSFVANFDDFDTRQDDSISSEKRESADKYAVFREIIEQELNSDMTENEDKIEDVTIILEDKILKEQSAVKVSKLNSDSNDVDKSIGDINLVTIPITKIDTKITEVISQAKDRYAALRDIILVEDLFEKINLPIKSITEEPKCKEDSLQNVEKAAIEDIDQNIDQKLHDTNDNSPEINISKPTAEVNDQMDKKDNSTTFNSSNNNNSSVNNRDDVELDKYMNRAISNLSLDSREHLSPVPLKSQNASTSPIRIQQIQSPNHIQQILQETTIKSNVNDMSTSPIPIQRSPLMKSSVQKSPLPKSPVEDVTLKSPVKQLDGSNKVETKKRINSDSFSDAVCGSSPEMDNNDDTQIPKTNNVSNECWAVFDQVSEQTKDFPPGKVSRDSKHIDSPCSSDGKDDWKIDSEYNRRWARAHTSSSSRDVSPWDEDGPEYRRRLPGADRCGHYIVHGRRINFCDEDYEYENDAGKIKERRIRTQNRSRDNFDTDSKYWYHSADHCSWSPENGDRPRSFDRSSYERSTYGPPYETRDHKYVSYDKRDYKNYDKRKYYKDYTVPEYNFEPYEITEVKDTKSGYYEDEYDQRAGKQKDYMEESNIRDRNYKERREYTRDRKSFDRESAESYDSGCGGRSTQREFGNRETFESVDLIRDNYVDKTRYVSTEKIRSIRKGTIKTRAEEDGYENDSDGELPSRRTGDTRSLQRSLKGSRPRKSSGSSPWDGEELTPTSIQSKSWKRPSSASESERRLTDNRRGLSHTLSGSDGEKDRRFRKKSRSRAKDADCRLNYATLRYSQQRQQGDDEYYDYDEPSGPQVLIRELSNIRLQENENQSYSKQQYYKSTTPRSEGRTMSESLKKQDSNGRISNKYVYEYDIDGENIKKFKKINNQRETYYDNKRDKFGGQKFSSYDEAKTSKNLVREYNFEEYETSSHGNGNKFNFDDEQGFESDFNSPSNGSKIFRFSNDFSEKVSPKTQLQNFSFESEFRSANSTKLRFDNNVIVSKFDNNSQMFEDDFSKAELSLENEDQWTAELPKKSLKITKPSDSIKKSESVNIFTKQSDDPFEDDEFFKSTADQRNSESKKMDPFHWEKNFAKFDDNI